MAAAAEVYVYTFEVSESVQVADTPLLPHRVKFKYYCHSGLIYALLSILHIDAEYHSIQCINYYFIVLHRPNITPFTM